jgi:hypothetical protein
MGRFATCATICFLCLAAGASWRLQGKDDWVAVLGCNSLAAAFDPKVHPATATAATSPVAPQIDSSLQDLIQRLPKAELHIHIEGTLEAAMMMRLAARNNVSLPYKSVEEAEAARCAACTAAAQALATTVTEHTSPLHT